MVLNQESDNNLSPFFLVRIGSTIDSTKRVFTLPVIPIAQTITIPAGGKHVETLMSGTSSYIYNDRLNQGSFGLVGSWGTTAAAKVATAVSGYVGNASASATKTIEIDYQVKMISGVEVINFNSLTPQDLFMALDKGTKEAADAALTAFNNLTNALQGRDLNAALQEANASSLQALVDDWATKVQAFLAANGDSIVVGIIWGGVGIVKLKITSTQTEKAWKYGGKGAFSYGSATTSFSVEAAYDGSQKNRQSDVNCDVSSVISGACVEEQVQRWQKIAEAKVFSELANIKLLDSAPSIASISNFPTLPDFKAPKKDKKVTDQFGQITSLEGIELFAQACAYDKYRETHPEATFEEFKVYAEAQADIRKIAEIQDKLKANEEDPLFGLNSVSMPLQTNDSEPFEQGGIGEDKPGFSNFTPLGVWVADWVNLFPFLATGYSNELTDRDKADIDATLKRQCMVQDLLALVKMYYAIDACEGIDARSFNMESFSQIATSFEQAVYNMTNSEITIADTYKALSPEAQKIYTHWNDMKFLRNAELGLGALLKRGTSIGFSLTNTVRSSSGVYPNTALNLGVAECSFSTVSKNFNAFASFLKLLPLITPNGDVYAFGPRDMLLQAFDDYNMTFSKRASTALKFKIDKENKALTSGFATLYPIPFSAAAGLGDSWKGQSLSTNLGSMKSLQDKLKKIQDNLAKSTVYTFSGGNWKNRKIGDSYGMGAINAKYIGMVNEIPGVF